MKIQRSSTAKGEQFISLRCSRTEALQIAMLIGMTTGPDVPRGLTAEDYGKLCKALGDPVAGGDEVVASGECWEEQAAGELGFAPPRVLDAWTWQSGKMITFDVLGGIDAAKWRRR